MMNADYRSQFGGCQGWRSRFRGWFFFYSGLWW